MSLSQIAMIAPDETSDTHALARNGCNSSGQRHVSSRLIPAVPVSFPQNGIRGYRAPSPMWTVSDFLELHKARVDAGYRMRRSHQKWEISGNVAILKHPGGHNIFIDADDLALVKDLCWCAKQYPNTKTTRYAITVIPIKDIDKIRTASIPMHRVILNSGVGQIIDHRDGNGLNNRRSNIRIVSHRVNSINTHNAAFGRSRFRGVVWHAKCRKWQGQIRCDGRSIYLGLYADEIDAATAYDAFAVRLHGEDARVNFPQRAAILGSEGA